MKIMMMTASETREDLGDHWRLRLGSRAHYCRFGYPRLSLRLEMNRLTSSGK